MKFLLLGLLSSLLLFQSGCKKKPSAGYGGNANVKLVAKHHGLVIDSITFYLKFNATDAPAEGTYDIVQKGVTVAVGNTSVIISGLKKGKYYIYAKGWDPSIIEEVKGGLPYTISEEVSQDIIVAVTE